MIIFHNDQVADFLQHENVCCVSSKGEIHFGKFPCDCCKDELFGNRHLIASVEKTTREIVEFEVCQDCLLVLA